ncbi:folylpolyglutamate synthase/dihydrofolate synthase family protein [uncultured Tenacibaculum sp.]|uniref:bifunctional folylpolyglutamate synthase/dihydrofolate synthase n=1 Tax=uncultured Tenacibaculum sp. TaxID=174713 RepID=UPI00262DA218|nr:folylpolyglutamate synthase/dihydrofolate synthase family protein [uncultured Tenacibaculum sp.]
MTYEEVVKWMFAQLPMYQRQGKSAFKKDLTNILMLSEHLDRPENKFKTIHIGGTNGKGSTSHMIASVLQEAGYKVGLYTSPHLKNFTERIRINGKEIDKNEVVEFIIENRAFLEKQKLSFFEMTVGMAFNYFAKEEVDVAIIEVGLGGRLDSTNIITPEVSVITNIGLDHTQFLGETLPEIAFEKAGIIKKGVPVVIGERQEEVEQVFVKKAQECDSEIMFASDNTAKFETDLLGVYQKNNVKTAVEAIRQLKGFSVSKEDVRKGLLNVVSNTNLKGRWQVLQENPKVVCDTAHNKEGLRYTLEQLKKERYQDLHIVLGMVSDKKISEILPLFPKNATYYFCKPDIPRGMEVESLKKICEEYGLVGRSFNSVKEAYIRSLERSVEEDVIYVGGSTFVVAEIL